MHSWQPSASIDTLKKRAAMIQSIRQFFHTRGYLEVETPQMSHYGVSDLYLENIKARFRNQSYYLQTSPEYHMKRLLAAGSGPIFQLLRAFRDDELGRWHNPEFTLLEWYQLDIDYHALMDEVDALLQEIAHCPPSIPKTYQQIFEEICGFDPFTVSLSLLQKHLKESHLDNVLNKDETDRDQYLFLLMSHIIEPALAKESSPVVIYNFPASQAALAEVHQGMALRFEFYYQGIELANGFQELTDVQVQRQRFLEDNIKRQEKGLQTVDVDPWLLEALSHGLPSCSGVALGVDRLLALALGLTSIDKVMAFDFSRA